ncbi:MAG: hypothetical protein ABL901_04650, partial [Hyphomicrobiaceae bacterium]
LTANKCQLTTPPTAFSGAPAQTWLASGAACGSDLPEVPACGLEASFVDALPGAMRRITLGGGKCLHVIPVMLTDKPDGFSCNAVKARPACVVGVRQDGTATIVTLAGGRDANALKAEIKIPTDPVRHKPLMAKSRSGPLMALIPADMTVGGNERDAQGFLRHYVDHTLATCVGSVAHCREQATYQGDRAVGELMRRVWNPRPLLSREDRTADYQELIGRVVGGDLGRFDREKKLFAKLIMQNEVAGSSPYQMLDAVIRNSGISWGAHQIDIGANASSEVDLFWDTLRRWRKAPGTGDYPKLRDADKVRACLSQPIRNFFVDQLALFYGALPELNKGFRSGLGKASYEARFKTYLDEEVARGVALGGLFKKSPFAWMYYIDQRNQRGATRANALKVIGEDMSAGELASCEGVVAGEERLVAAIKGITETGDHYDIDRRVTNLKTFLQQELGASLGRVCG